MNDGTIGMGKAMVSHSSRLWFQRLGRCVGLLEEETVMSRRSEGFTINKSY